MPPDSGFETARERAFLMIFTMITAIAGTVLPSALFLAPVPLAVLVYRHGLRPGTVAALLAGSAAGLLVQHPAVMLLVLLVLGVGVAIGEALRDGLTFNQTLLMGWLTAYLAFGALYVISRLAFNMDLVDATVRIWLDQLNRLARLPGGMQFSAQEINQLVGYMKSILPGMLAISAAAICLFDYWLTAHWLRRFDIEVPVFPPFGTWRFPWYLAWGYIAGIGLPLLRGTAAAPWIMPVAANLELAFQAVFMVQGLAVAWYYLERWRFSRPFRFVLAAILLFFTPLLVFIGLLDAWFNLRRLQQR